MKKLEKILPLLILIAFLLKLNSLPGASALFILSISSLSVLYYFGFLLFNNIRLRHVFKKSAYQGSTAQRIIGSIGLGISFSCILMGCLFKLLFWVGSHAQLTLGLFLLSIAMVFALLKNKGKASNFYTPLYKRSIIIGLSGILLYATPATSIADVFYRNDPEYLEAFKRLLKDPQNEEYLLELEEMRQKKYSNPRPDEME